MILYFKYCRSSYSRFNGFHYYFECYDCFILNLAGCPIFLYYKAIIFISQPNPQNSKGLILKPLSIDPYFVIAKSSFWNRYYNFRLIGFPKPWKP